jgi:hypothetical protein
MQILRLAQRAEGERHRVEITLEGDGVRQTSTSKFEFALSMQDEQNLRWYLEDYLEACSEEDAKDSAGRVEQRMSLIGTELFRAVFDASNKGRQLWMAASTRLPDTRVEIVTDVEGGVVIPWELLLDPTTDSLLALRARSFVRTHPEPLQSPQLPVRDTDNIRVLLVICRPDKGMDIPFRSVASHLVRLGSTTRRALQLDVLRPPGFSDLGRILETAKLRGKPYHIVHFDGHGIHVDINDEDQLREALGVRSSPPSLSVPGTLRTGRHGYLVFEDPNSSDNLQLIDGTTLGQALVESDVSVLVLNACRSAHAEVPAAPNHTDLDLQSQVRAYGSLAQEAMGAGVAGVVSMRYNIFVATAAKFVVELYAALLQGLELGAAAKLARKQLASHPVRQAGEPVRLQDWSVPVIYEAAPMPLVAGAAGPDRLIIVTGGAGNQRGLEPVDPRLPTFPDGGFVGRDETLLALDRAFDTESVVVLYGEEGSGTTATAAEFARWYARTGGVRGPVLFTSFARFTALATLLEELARAFRSALKAEGLEWRDLSPDDRRSVALQVLQQREVLWIWDGVYSVGDRPGRESVWPQAEQGDLAEFLRATRDTRAKILLTSRDDESAWLGQLPARIMLPDMPMRERIRLTRTIMAKYRRPFGTIEDWRPLLRATRGNPTIIATIVSKAAEEGNLTKEYRESLTAQLQNR